eukprot:SAG11_NODE_2678_length_3105_cov_2.120758_1_plen_148_part_00
MPFNSAALGMALTAENRSLTRCRWAVGFPRLAHVFWVLWIAAQLYPGCPETLLRAAADVPQISYEELRMRSRDAVSPEALFFEGRALHITDTPLGEYANLWKPEVLRRRLDLLFNVRRAKCGSLPRVSIAQMFLLLHTACHALPAAG